MSDSETPQQSSPAELEAEELRAFVAAKLEAMPVRHAKKLAAELGIKPDAVQRIAKKSGIRLKGKPEACLYYPLMEICDNLPIKKIAALLGLNESSLCAAIYRPELVSDDWYKEVMEPKLLGAFESKKQKILAFTDLAGKPNQDVQRMKRAVKGKTLEEFRAEARKLVRNLLNDLDENCGLPVEVLKTRMTNPMISRNLEDMKHGEKLYAGSVYLLAIGEFNRICGKIERPETKRHLQKLNDVAPHLKR